MEQASPTGLHANRSDMFNVAVDRRRDMTPDDYEEWLADALPHLLLKPELLHE